MIHNTSIKYFMIFAITHSRRKFEGLHPEAGSRDLKTEPCGLQVPSHRKSQAGPGGLKAVHGVCLGKEAAPDQEKGTDDDPQAGQQEKGKEEPQGYAAGCETEQEPVCQPDKEGGDGQGGQHVPGGVTAQVHAGKPHQQDHGKEKGSQAFSRGAQAQGSIETGGALGVAAGEGVARGSRHRAPHRGKGRVQHPGAGDAKGDLQRLHGKPCQEVGKADLKGQLLADAPVEETEHQYDGCLLPQACDKLHDPVCGRGAQRLQKP